MEKSPKKPITKRKWFWPVVGVVAIGAIAGGGGDKEEQKQPPVEPDKSVVQVDTSDTSAVIDVSEPVVDVSSDTSTQPAEQELQEPAESKYEPGKTKEPTEPDKPKEQTKQQSQSETKKPEKNTNSAGKERRSNWSSGAYLGSTESDKYHDYECRAAKKILPENEVWFSSETDAQAAGYSRCGICW